MPKLAITTAGTIALLLAGCGSNDAPSANVIEAAVNHADATADAVKKAAEKAPPVPTESAQPVSEIPEAFLGRWGMTANDCEPGRADAKGLMEVTAHRLIFYESRATPTSILQTAPEELNLQLTYAGEGQTWERSTRFRLGDGGRSLVREEQSPDATFRYDRCPA